MSILPHFVVFVLGVLSFLFMFWRRLKEDYSARLIFDAGFTIIASAISGYAMSIFLSKYVFYESHFFNPQNLWFWSSFIGLTVGVKISEHRFKLKLVETFEAAIFGTSIWIALIYSANYLQTKDSASLGFFVVIVFLVPFFYFFESRYRRLSWYKSGKVGFSGIAVVALFFLVRIVFALSDASGFSFVGKIDPVLSAITVFLLVFSLYNLSEAG